MIQLTILPPEHRAKLDHERRQRFIARALLSIGLILALAVVAFWGIGYALTQKFDEVNERLLNAGQGGRRVPLAGITEVVAEQYHLVEAVRSPTSVVQLIADLIEAAPPGISLSELRYEGTDRQVVLVGFATDRNVFLAFRERLESIETIEEVRVPISNLATPTDIPFTITSSLTPPAS